MLWEQQLYEAAGELEQGAGRGSAREDDSYTQLELMDQSELETFDPQAMFYSDEYSAASNSDPVTENQTVSGKSENADIWEQSFLSGLQGDTENDTIFGENQGKTSDASQKLMTAQERLAMLGTLLLDKGGMPSDAQLSAMGMDKPTARGIQSLVWLSKEGSPAQQRAVEAMVELTAPQRRLEQRQDADFARVPAAENAYALNGFDGSNSSTGFRLVNFDDAAYDRGLPVDTPGEQPGTLTGSLEGLTADEKIMVDALLAFGKNVEIIPRSNVQKAKTPDFLVNGVKTELKTLSGTSLNTPITRIQKGFKQGAEVVIIDARKTKITLDDAKTIVNRAVGTYGGKLPGKIEIWTVEGILRRE